MVTTPKIRVSTSPYSSSARPRPPNAAPKATNTAVNPSTNSSAPRTMRPRGERSSVVRTPVAVPPPPLRTGAAARVPVPTSPAT
jgi:hypothetical protein